MRRFAAWLFTGASLLGLASGVRGDADAPLATFTGGQITRADVEEVIAHRLPVEQRRFASDGVKSLVESLIRYDLLVQEAEKRGYSDNINVREAVRHRMAELVVQAEAQTDPASFSAEEVAAARETRKQEFEAPELRRASHILVATKPEALALIHDLKHVDREQFARVATERSGDLATKHQGGELGYFARDGVVDRGGRKSLVPPQLTAAAFALAKAGEITSQPIAMSEGFSVLMLTAVRPVFKAPEKEVDERVREQLAEQKRVQKGDAFVEALRKDYHLVVHPELVDQLDFPATVEPTGIPEGFPAAPPDPREPPKLVEPDGI